MNFLHITVLVEEMIIILFCITSDVDFRLILCYCEGKANK